LPGPSRMPLVACLLHEEAGDVEDRVAGHRRWRCSVHDPELASAERHRDSRGPVVALGEVECRGFRAIGRGLGQRQIAESLLVRDRELHNAPWRSGE